MAFAKCMKIMAACDQALPICKQHNPVTIAAAVRNAVADVAVDADVAAAAEVAVVQIGSKLRLHMRAVTPPSVGWRESQTIWCCSLWSFPLNLPLPLLGIFNAKVLETDDMQLPWSQELSHKASK